jgi:hypothetical protein
MPGAVLGGGSLLPEPELEELDELEELELPYVVICTSPLSYVFVTVVVLPSLPLVTVFGTLSKFRGWPYTTSPL